ncbi:DCC1-like thiol-disulfide oxidoreductase family protein [Halobacteriovorax sp.]|uniref:DCC1-like thiol-disulfide oxidoreductase family protein n=1 Tax=Halobacteriovorax sp. TaxID=2020862 RepID=UPI003562D56E
MEVQSTSESFSPILIYDSECSLCERFASTIKRMDSTSHIELISLKEEEVYENFPILNRLECEKEVHLLIEADQVLKGPKVIEYLITLNPTIKKISWLIQSNAGQKAMDIFYKSSNLYRESLLNRCPKCKNK